jgi:hypothetical protein
MSVLMLRLVRPGGVRLPAGARGIACDQRRAAVEFLAAFPTSGSNSGEGVAAAPGSIGTIGLLFDVGIPSSMARKTDSLFPLIIRLLIAAAIAGLLTLGSLAIERPKGFFKLSDEAGTYKMIGTRPARLPPPPVRSKSIYCEQTSRSFNLAL